MDRVDGRVKPEGALLGLRGGEDEALAHRPLEAVARLAEDGGVPLAHLLKVLEHRLALDRPHLPRVKEPKIKQGRGIPRTGIPSGP